MNRPQLYSFEKLVRRNADQTAVTVTSSAKRWAKEKLPFRIIDDLRQSENMKCLIAVGGGTLLDKVKFWRVKNSPDTELIVIPSIWGSGAEISPIVVLNENWGKELYVDDRFLPDAMVICKELAATVPAQKTKSAYGDCWSHALEGFLSPLAKDSLRVQLARLINQMVQLSLTNDSNWFELSTEACEAQLRSSVGLVHGIAHTLEIPLKNRHHDMDWGHAILCSVYLWPVMSLNEQFSNRFTSLMSQHEVNKEQVMGVLKNLYDQQVYEKTISVLAKYWPAILRNPCSRTNCTLIKPQHLNFLTTKAFE